MSILILIALAVAFLSGLRATAPNMKATGHNYFESVKLADLQFIGNLGLTDDDLAAIKALPEIEEAEAVYSIDAFAASATMDKIAKVHSMPQSGINQPLLKEGRMPEKKNECVIEEGMLKVLNMNLGDTITLTPQESMEDYLIQREFTVVGTVRSPLYIATERGSSSIGTGSVALFMYILPDCFDCDYYTNIYARIVKTPEMQAFYPEYDDYVDDLIDSLEAFADERAKARYDEIYIEGNDKINDAQQELDDAQKKIDDAQNELDDGQKRVDDGQKRVNDGRRELEDARKKVEDGQKELDENRIKVEDGWKKLEDGKKEFAEGEQKIADAQIELDDAQKQLDDAREEANRELKKALRQLRKGENEYADGLAQLNAAVEAFPAFALTPEYADALQQLNDARNSLDYGWADYVAGQDAADRLIAENQAKLDDAKKELEDAKKELEDSRIEIEDAERELEDAQKQLDDAQKELDDAQIELADAQIELDDAQREIDKARKDIAEARPKVEDAKKELEDAKPKLADARKDLEDIPDGKWYVFSRSYNPGYSGLGQDADRMGNLAKVFPIIFFLVAALVCLTTMTRMVEEQRMQIGSLKALGYSRFAISQKYIGYGLFPALIGSVAGLAIGFSLFPTMIFTAYQIMYRVPNIELHIYSDIAVGCVIAAIASTSVATLAACLKTLKEVPATLMRPKTPQAGKRVMLEKLGFIWKRLSFIHKVTARNLFRYQKRFWMTVIGIGGCTALIIVGFGIRSSLIYTMHRQYEELYHYDATVAIADDIDDEDRSVIEHFFETDSRVVGHEQLRMYSVTARGGSNSQTAYVYALDTDTLAKYIDIYAYGTSNIIRMDNNGIYIDQKLSELLNVRVGDMILLDGDDKVNARIAGIFEHYTGHFVYMTPEYYEQLYETDYVPTGAFLTLSDDTKETCESVFEELMKFDGVSGTSRMRDVRDTYLKSMERIDFVVVIVIMAAGALALVVLYNLSNINITERKRELATIKVLGFYDGEVSAYVYRENVILTIFGIASGVLMGHYLHQWLVKSVEIDLMMFGRQTDPKAYLYAAILTALFALLANIMAHFKMKKIDMVESLKSAE